MKKKALHYLWSINCINVCIRGYNYCQTGIELSKYVYLASMGIKTSSPKGNARSPESNVPRSNLIKKKQQQKTIKWAMETRGPKSNLSELLCLSWLPATLMMIRSEMIGQLASEILKFKSVKFSSLKGR